MFINRQVVLILTVTTKYHGPLHESLRILAGVVRLKERLHQRYTPLEPQPIPPASPSHILPGPLRQMTELMRW